MKNLAENIQNVNSHESVRYDVPIWQANMTGAYKSELKAGKRNTPFLLVLSLTACIRSF